MQTRIIAHRGALADAPENTLAAFALALEQGAQMIEFDVRPTRDRQIVVFHDDTTERWNGRSEPIDQMTLAELQEVDLRGARAPTLDEVCDWARTTDLALNVEIKVAGIEDGVARILRDHRLGERVVISSFDFAALEQMRAVAPELALGALMGTDSTPSNRPLPGDWPLSTLRRLGARAWHPSWELPDLDQLIPRVRQAGYAVNVWTVDDPALMRRLLSLEVEGIMTNRPALLQQVMQEWTTNERSRT